MQKITPHLWFDTQAKEAAEFYIKAFGDGKVTNVTTIHDTPSGDAGIVSLELFGQDFMLLNAGPYFKFTPAISFLVACKTKEEVDAIWKELSPGAFVMMELGEYPFSEKYGWLADKYGLSWQIMFMGDRPIAQRITPTLMFVGDRCGKAEEAMNFYASIFHDAKIGNINRYGASESPDKEGTVRHAGFTLEGQEFAAMDSAHKHQFSFNEAVSFIVNCETQEEIDYYWDKLSADPKAEQCGWLKDKFGVSWQVSPSAMNEMMKDKDEKKRAAVTQAFLKMKKFDLAELERVYNEA